MKKIWLILCLFVFSLPVFADNDMIAYTIIFQNSGTATYHDTDCEGAGIQILNNVNSSYLGAGITTAGGVFGSGGLAAGASITKTWGGSFTGGRPHTPVTAQAEVTYNGTVLWLSSPFTYTAGAPDATFPLSLTVTVNNSTCVVGVVTNIVSTNLVDTADPGENPPPNYNSPPPPDPQCPDCGSCSSGGMPTWRVSQPYISLWLQDEPLGYQPAVGPRISFKLAFKQRETASGYNTNWFSVGKKWNFSWLSYVALDSMGSNVVYFPGGGQQTFNATNNYFTNARLTGNTNTGFTLSYADGSQDVYGFVVTNNNGAFQEAFLTARINAQGQQTTLNYSSYTPAAFPVIRLQSVVDGDGHANLIYYNSSNVYSTNLISMVVDPFGRTNSLAYDNSGHLTNSVDVAGISSSFTYDTNDWVGSLTTPYGSTGFNIIETTTIPAIRSVLVTQPDDGHQLYLYRETTNDVPSSYPTNQIPNTSPYTNTLDTTDLNLCNTFYWGPRQYTALSTTNISAFTTNDFRKAQMFHWLKTTNNVLSQTVSMKRDPSPDSAGMIEGQKTWYDYTGKTNAEYIGTQVMPLLTARVLPDGTTSFTRTECNSLGAMTAEVSTYSVGGTVALRTNLFSYDANGIDLLTTTNALGVQISRNIYNANHEVATNYDALNESTVNTYDGSQRLTSTALPSGLVTTNIYGADGFLSQQIAIGFATNSYTYANDLVSTHTDPRGLTTTNTWDALNRLTGMAFPDGSTISNLYTFMDVTATKDRLGNWTYFGYDNMRRKIIETNVMQQVTLWNYCTCGSLESIEDAAGNSTYFNYDNQGNTLNVTNADGYVTTRAYDLLRRVVVASDSGGNSITNTYNNQGLQIAVSNTFGRVQGTVYDTLDRATNSVDANGVSINTTYDNLNRPLTRSYPDTGVEHWAYTLNVSGATSYTNQIGKITLYGFDAMNRKTNEVYVGVTTNSFTFSGAGDMLMLTDGKNQTTSWNFDEYGRPTNKIDAASNLILAYKYDPNNRLTNRWSIAKGSTTYKYDALGNPTNIIYPNSPAISLAYDVLNHLTNMVDAVGTTRFTWDSVNELLSEDGPWANDTVSYTMNNRLRTGLSLSQPNASAWNQSYAYDVARRMTNTVSPAGAFGYLYPSANFQMPSAILLPNGAYITNTYDNLARELSTILKNSGNAVLDSEAYAYNQGNQRTSETNTAGDFRNYTYDNINELKTAIGKEAGGVTNRWQEQLGYTYDAAQNLNYRTNNTLLQQFNANNLNELITITNGGRLTVAGTTTGAATNVTVNTSNAVLYADATFASTNQPWVNGNNSFIAIAKDVYGRIDTNAVTVNLLATNTCAYDLNGNMITNCNKTLDYDDENELIRVTVPNSWKDEFAYDGKMRRRILKEFTWNGSSWTQTNEVHYIYDGNMVIQERDTNNLPLVSYTSDGSELLARTDNSQLIGGGLFAHAYYHSDGNGNVMCLIYANQTIAAKYLYDSFGNTLSLSGSLASANVYRFSSKEWDENLGLYYFGRRYYDPNLQRWLNRDPIAEKGGLNLYAYVVNNPLTFYDPFGLDSQDALASQLFSHYLFGGGSNLSINSDALASDMQQYESAILQQFSFTLCNNAQAGDSGNTLGYNNNATADGGTGGILTLFLNQGHLKVTTNWERKSCQVCFSDIQLEFQDEIILKDFFRSFPAGWQTHFPDTYAFLITNGDPPYSLLTAAGMFREYQVQIKWSDPKTQCFKCQK